MTEPCQHENRTHTSVWTVDGFVDEGSTVCDDCGIRLTGNDDE